MATRTSFLIVPLAVATSFAAAQSTTLPPVTVQGRSDTATADVTGFGDVPLERSPLQARVLGEAALTSGGGTLRELTRRDASTSDAYNSEGYWDQFSVRGYVIDNRYNYRRDGLPINAETSIPLDNKSRVELLKGISGMQAGTSAPGGLVNLVVKRPAGEVRSAMLELAGRSSVLGAVDLGTRFGADQAFGLRLNAAAARIDPELRAARGQRHLLALAGDWRLGPGSLLEAEVEISRRSQPSQPGFSLLGDRVPDARDIDPRINLNNQPWSLPVVLQGRTASLRWTQPLASGWRARLHIASQQLKSDDRIAFPFGCGAEGNDDRYCSDGTFDLYDFRSDNERRRTDAADASLQGRLRFGGIDHRLTTGVLASRLEARFEGQAFNDAGTGRVDGGLLTPAAPDAVLDNTHRSERNTEFYVRDAMKLTEDLGLWLGLRHTRLSRDSITTSETEATAYRQSFTTPWLAASLTLSARNLAYASWGQGIESQVVPNRPGSFTNPGQALPALKSRQAELGLKHAGERFDAQLAVFDIERPATNVCAVSPCALVVDGVARHRGLEAGSEARLGAWSLGASAMWLRARREGSADAALESQRPPNVPARTLRLNGGYRFEGGLSLSALLTAESDRTVLPTADSPRIAGWARLDVGARYEQRAGGSTLIWRAGIDNLADRRAWRESPYQFGHAYLYPLAPRTWRVSLSADL